MSFHLPASSPGGSIVTVTDSEPASTGAPSTTPYGVPSHGPAPRNSTLHECVRTFQESQTELAGWMARCNNLPSELGELLSQKTERFLHLQTALLQRLSGLPRSPDELQPVHRLLQTHRDFLHAAHNQLDQIPVEAHIQILRQWSHLVRAGARALKQLPASANIRDCNDLFRLLICRFDAAGSEGDCTTLLALMEGCLQRITLEQRQAAARDSRHRLADQRHQPPSPLALGQQGGQPALSVTVTAPVLINNEPTVQPAVVEPFTVHASGAFSPGSDAIERDYPFLDLLQQPPEEAAVLAVSISQPRAGSDVSPPWPTPPQRRRRGRPPGRGQSSTEGLAGPDKRVAPYQVGHSSQQKLAPMRRTSSTATYQGGSPSTFSPEAPWARSSPPLASPLAWQLEGSTDAGTGTGSSGSARMGAWPPSASQRHTAIPDLRALMGMQECIGIFPDTSNLSLEASSPMIDVDLLNSPAPP